MMMKNIMINPNLNGEDVKMDPRVTGRDIGEFAGAMLTMLMGTGAMTMLISLL